MQGFFLGGFVDIRALIAVGELVCRGRMFLFVGSFLGWGRLSAGAKFNMAHGDKISTLSTVFEDNRAAKILAETDPPRLTPRSKSLAIKCHWFRSHIGLKNGKGIILEDVRSKLNKADFLTKAMPRDAFRTNRLAVCGW